MGQTLERRMQTQSNLPLDADRYWRMARTETDDRVRATLLKLAEQHEAEQLDTSNWDVGK